VSRQEIGLYCEACENRDFGNLLEKPSWHQDNGCAFCDNPGTYKLPQLDCLIEDDGIRQYIEYMIFDDTIAICESHLKELLPRNTVIEDLVADQHESNTKVRA
jgi:hypothetical protein